jgi:hypothetical protein
LNKNVCTSPGSILKLREVKYGSDLCSVTADVVENLRETVIITSKHILEELDVLHDNLLKLPKLYFVLNLKSEKNISLLFSFIHCKSFL